MIRPFIVLEDEMVPEHVPQAHGSYRAAIFNNLPYAYTALDGCQLKGGLAEWRLVFFVCFLVTLTASG